jgi:Protein of unknown function (DUF3618)
MTAPESSPETAQDIQAEIERTREDLGQTVEELAAKADVKARAHGKAAEMKATAQGKAADVKATAQGKAVQLKSTAAAKADQLQRSEIVQRHSPLAAAAAGVLVVGAILIWKRRKT